MVLFPCVKRFIRKYAQYLRCFPLISPLSGQTIFSLPSRSAPAVISVQTFLICSSSTPCQSPVRSASIPHLKNACLEKMICGCAGHILPPLCRSVFWLQAEKQRTQKEPSALFFSIPFSGTRGIPLQPHTHPLCWTLRKVRAYSVPPLRCRSLPFRSLP